MEKPYVYNLYIGFLTPFITYNWCLGPPCIVGISSAPGEKSQESIFSNSKPMVQTITLWVSSYLLMAEILHQLRLVVYPVIYRVLHPRWLFGISEPSTVARNSTPLFNPICLTFFRIHEGSCPVLYLRNKQQTVHTANLISRIAVSHKVQYVLSFPALNPSRYCIAHMDSITNMYMYRIKKKATVISYHAFSKYKDDISTKNKHLAKW